MVLFIDPKSGPTLGDMADAWTQVAAICRAAIDWGHARQAVLAEETPDVRTSESFRVRLEALATAEAALVAAVKSRKETK